METVFTPVTAAAGGALIGLSAVLLMLFIGRIAGVSGVVSRLLPPGADWDWRIAFIAGVVVAPLAWRALGGETPVAVTDNVPTLIIAGLLVGVGATLGSGCTSGHGVCGMARLSVRSIVSTLVYLTTAIVMVYIVRHVMGG